jgi:hypothetical protein
MSIFFIFSVINLVLVWQFFFLFILDHHEEKICLMSWFGGPCTLPYMQIDEMPSKLYWIKTQPDEMILVIFKQVNLSLQKALFCELRYIHLPKLGFPISIKKGSFAETERTIVSLEFRLFRETKNVRNSVASHTSEKRRYRNFVTNHYDHIPEYY